VKIDFQYEDGYPPTINHDGPTEKLRISAEKVAPGKVDKPYLSMGGEDFSYYLKKIPGSFVFVGSRPADREPMEIPHHCSHFDIDEAALLLGTSLFVQLILDN